MISKIWNAKALHILLGFIFLVGLLPISNHMLPMQAMPMDTGMSHNMPVHEKSSDNSTGSCCEAIGSLLLACDFMVFPSVWVGLDRGSEQIAYSIPVIHSIYIQTLSPPPKA